MAYINHFNIIIVIYYPLWVVKTNAEMSRFMISCHSKHTYSNLYDRDQPTLQTDRQTDRQTEDTTVHRMVKCMPILLRDLEVSSLS